MGDLGTELPQIAFYIGSGLLLLSGGAKVIQPLATRRALSLARLPSSKGIVSGLGILEILIGSACLATANRAFAAAFAITYLGFAGFVFFLMKFAPEASSCGCVAGHDSSPSRLHVFANLGMSCAGAAVFVNGGIPLVNFISEFHGLELPLLIAMSALGYALYALVVYFLPAYSALNFEVPEPTGQVEQPKMSRFEAEDLVLSQAGITPGHPSLMKAHLLPNTSGDDNSPERPGIT